MRKMCISLLLLLASCILMLGCAGEQAAMTIAGQTGAIAEKVLQEGKLTDMVVSAQGRLQDPHYIVQAFWVTGIHLDIGLNGAFLAGDITGSGTGAELTTDERIFLNDCIHESLSSGHPLLEAIDSGLDRLERYIKDKNSAKNPTPP